MSLITRSALAQAIDRDFAKEIPALLAENYTPRLKRSPSQWASEVRILPEGSSPISNGQSLRYDHAIMPHCVEPMDAADDPSIRKIVLWFAIRDGKTMGVCANIIGRTVTDAPGGIYSVHPIEDDRDKFSEGDIEPMIEACLEGYFIEKKSRDSGRTITFKKFKGGWLRLVSAGALTAFRGSTVAVLLLHELDALNPKAIWKAFGRTTGFADAIIVMESTGTLAAEITPEGRKDYRSNIEEAYDQGDKRKWFCACQHCGYLQTLKYEQIKWPPGKMESAVYTCEACEGSHSPLRWRRMAATGKWYPTAGLTEAQERDIANNWRHARALDPSVRSYWRNGFNSLLPHSKGYKSKLHQFAAEGEAAQRSPVAKMIWTQETKAELWSPESEGEVPPAWKPIFDRREDYGLVVPQGGLFLTAFVDCQLNRLECGWRAWGMEEESWGMDHVVIEGHVRDGEVWRALRQELARKWTHESKATLRLGMAFVDGGAYAEDVYRFFQDLARNPMPGVTGHCRASKGFGQHGHPIITKKMMTIAKNLKGHHIGTWEAKDRIYERLRMKGGDELCAQTTSDLRMSKSKTPQPCGLSGKSESANPKSASNAAQTSDPDARRVINDTNEGVMHFNRQYSEEYFQQLTAEQVTVIYEKGQEVRKYVNPKAARNEALDIEVGNLAAYRLHPHNLAALANALREEAEIVNGIKQPAPAKTAAESFAGKGWRL